MRNRFTRLKKVAWLALVLGTQAVQAQQLNLSWQPRQDLNILLPASVRVHEANGSLPDGAPVRAMYATVDLRDENLSLRTVGNPANRQTTLEHYQDYNAILAINGGYFAPTKSVSLYISDGNLIEPGIRKSGGNNITRGAFGLVNGKPEIAWTANPIGNLIYKYSQPTQPGQPAPTTRGGELWLPGQEIGRAHV